MVSRVVPAMGDATTRSSPTRALKRVDLPALGGPARITRGSEDTAVATAAVDSRSRSSSSAIGIRPLRSSPAVQPITSSSSVKSMLASSRAIERRSPSASRRRRCPESDSRKVSAASNSTSRSAAIPAAIPVASASSRLPARNARAENSPGPASRASPRRSTRCSRSSCTMRSASAGFPGISNSTVSSPVNEPGPGAISRRTGRSRLEFGIARRVHRLRKNPRRPVRHASAAVPASRSATEAITPRPEARTRVRRP